MERSNVPATIGVVITASHNPEGDNGLKLVDPNGEMLAAHWETHASLIANSTDENLGNSIKELVEKEDLDLSIPSLVFVGRDTRKSSLAFKDAVERGVKCVGGEFVDYGVVSTPLLHFLVVCANRPTELPEPTPNSYYTKLSNAFRRLMHTDKVVGSYTPCLILDGANGVGAFAAEKMTQLIPKSILDLQIFNDGTSGGTLNYKCGADFVKVEKKSSISLPIQRNARYVSFDGDADRIIYFYFDDDDTFCLLDGDKIAVLFAQHFGDLLKRSGITNLKLGLIQTAYANGRSTDYIQKDLGIPVSCALTGVKHLHHEAATKYDIGVYFEANGHGTVVFSERAIASIVEVARNEENVAGVELASLMDVTNPYVGDALSDMLGVEAILRSKGWSISDWNAMYTDFPNRLFKVSVEDRTVIETTDAERVVVSPPAIQAEIDALCAEYPNGRSFIRPSGTEDVVRIYAEANTQPNADALGTKVAQLVYDSCKGVGTRPASHN